MNRQDYMTVQEKLFRVTSEFLYSRRLCDYWEAFFLPHSASVFGWIMALKGPFAALTR